MNKNLNGTESIIEEVIWDDSKAEDKVFLKKWYQYRYEVWASKPEILGGKVAEHYRKAVNSLS